MAFFRHRLLNSRRAWVVFAVAALVLWFLAAHPRGMLMAYIDHARGHYEVKIYGLPAPWQWKTAELLQEKYGVKLNGVAGCVVTDTLVRYVRGYNSVSRRLLAERYGRDVLEECYSLAWQEWLLKRILASFYLMP